MASKYTQGIEIDEDALNLMRFLIIKLERDNEKTKKYTQKDMVDRIMKIIKEEAK